MFIEVNQYTKGVDDTEMALFLSPIVINTDHIVYLYHYSEEHAGIYLDFMREPLITKESYQRIRNMIGVK